VVVADMETLPTELEVAARAVIGRLLLNWFSLGLHTQSQ
jgi:hypothetical protein